MNHPRVTIYSLPTCGYCQMAKAYFKQHHIVYKEVDVDKDPRFQLEMIAKSGQYSVPVIDIDGEVVVGFKKDILDTLLRD